MFLPLKYTIVLKCSGSNKEKDKTWLFCRDGWGQGRNNCPGNEVKWEVLYVLVFFPPTKVSFKINSQ